MKVLSILGSPRRNGYTSALLNAYLNGLKANMKETDVTEVYLDKMIIKGCKGCNACQSNKVEFCISDDDMQKMYKEIIESDVIVLASPIYFFNVTAQMKTFLDRLYAILNQVAGKKFVFLSTYGAEKFEESGVQNAINMFEMTSLIAGTELIQDYHVSTAREEDNTFSNKKALEEVYKLAYTLDIKKTIYK